MGQVQNRIKELKAELDYYLETRPAPSNFTPKFRNTENELHFKDGRFSALFQCLAIITFFEAVFDSPISRTKIENWDQDKLRDIFFAIKKHGDNPEEYIDLHYSVSEEKFNYWPEHIKNIFKPARINKESNND